MKPLKRLKGSEYFDIQVINNKIDEINTLIEEYNHAVVGDKAEILLEIEQLYTSLDVNVSTFHLLLNNIIMDEYVDEFYKPFRDNLRQEFKHLGLESYRSATINYWGIKNTCSDEGIPSATRFAEMTKPGFWARLFGFTNSVAIKEAARLLSEISQSSIKENTKENYLQLTELNRSIRELIGSRDISQSDKKILRNLVSTINGRINDILENNEALNREIEPRDFPLADSVSKATDENVDALTAYLSSHDDFDETVFHERFDTAFPGMEGFTVRFLGGENSKNYLITDSITQERFILKVTPGKGNSAQTAERLKNTEVNNNLTEFFVSRERIGSRASTLEITEFCANGDVLSYGKKMDTPAAKLASAADIYHQMSDVLLAFGANNALFPDMKPTNFLVTEDGKLVIADTKSFVDTSGGEFDSVAVRASQMYLYTPGMEPPELTVESTKTNVDKHHAFLMGVSLYLYLTETDMGNLPREYDASFFNLEHPVFTSEKGQQFKQLIQDLLKVNPEERLGLNAARQKLEEIQHEIKVEHSPFKSRTEAYFYSINHLMGLQKNYPDNPVLAMAINDLKILVENHEKNPKVAAEIMQRVSEAMKETLTSEEASDLLSIAKAIRTSAYHQTAQEKYENPLARRFESQMQVELLKNPTSAMMKSVGDVSKGLLNIFAQMEQSDPESLKQFVKSLSVENKHQTGFGSQPKSVSYEEIKTLLEKNDPKDLNQIMFIQFLFAQKQMRNLPEEIQAPNKGMPSGKLKQIIEEYNGGQFRDNPAAFFDNMDYDKLRLISDVRIYGSPLFTAEGGRGRKGALPETFSSQMGLMLVGQNEDGLPVDPSSWTPDAKYQGANLSSIYVRDLIENDAVYAAGPSGMTSLFLNIMEMYGNFADVTDKQNYLAAVSAYMISGGFHSLHEVIGPAQYALDLVPGYNVTPPVEDKVGAPPNFHQFYQQQMELDPQFKERYDSGWDKLMAVYAEQQHMHVHQPIIKHDETSVIHRVAAKETPDVAPDLTSKQAADKLVDNINNALIKYSAHISSNSPIRNKIGFFGTHGKAGIERASALLEKARNETSLEGVTKVLSSYFNNQLTSLSGESYSNKSRANNHSFISYLLNELKNEPELVAFLNENNLTGGTLVLASDKDYTQSSATSERSSAFQAFKSIAIDPKTSEVIDKFSKYKSQMNAIVSEENPATDLEEGTSYTR